MQGICVLSCDAVNVNCFNREVLCKKVVEAATCTASEDIFSMAAIWLVGGLLRR